MYLVFLQQALGFSYADFSSSFSAYLSPFQCSALQIPGTSASQSSDLSILNSERLTLCCSLESASWQKVRVVVGLTSFVALLLGITVLSASCPITVNGCFRKFTWYSSCLCPEDKSSTGQFVMTRSRSLQVLLFLF